MIADGVMVNPAPDVMFGLHLWSQIPLGQAVVKAGPLWAAADRFALEIVGRGSHGAMPHQGIDAIAVAAYAITQLQTIISRDRDPLQPAVLSIGTIQGGSAFNVLAERVQMSGTLRTFDPATRARIIERMHGLLGGVCAAHGASYQLTFRDYAPPVVNDAGATEHLRAAAAAVLGDEAVADGPMMMVAEDVAEFLDRTPGSFFVLGAMPETAAAGAAPQPPFRHRRARPAAGCGHPGAGYVWLAARRTLSADLARASPPDLTERPILEMNSLQTSPTEADKQALVARLTDARNDLLRLVRSVPAERLEAPGAVGDWSVKDVIGHIASWEDRLLTLAQMVLNGHADKIEWIGSDEALQAWNHTAVPAQTGLDLGRDHPRPGHDARGGAVEHRLGRTGAAFPAAHARRGRGQSGRPAGRHRRARP